MRLENLIMVGLFVGSIAIAADQEHSDSTTTDTSKNPITGTVTTTKKMTKKKKTEHGEEKMEVTEKTKMMKDGSIKKTTEVETTKEKEKTH